MPVAALPYLHNGPCLALAMGVAAGEWLDPDELHCPPEGEYYRRDGDGTSSLLTSNYLPCRSLLLH